MADPFEVFVNGVAQHAGVDYDQVRALRSSFAASWQPEGRLGFWRWLSLFFGVAGTYRRNDSVDVVYNAAGRRTVVSLTPEPPD